MERASEVVGTCVAVALFAMIFVAGYVFRGDLPRVAGSCPASGHLSITRERDRLVVRCTP